MINWSTKIRLDDYTYFCKAAEEKYDAKKYIWTWKLDFYNFSILVFKFGLLVIVDVLQMLNIFKKITNQKSKQ